MTNARFCLAGAALDSGNRGVEALARSVLFGIERHLPGSHVTVLDNGWGVRAAPAQLHPALVVELAGVRTTRRWHRPESWSRITLSQRLRTQRNPVAARIAHADAVLDISGGDSFTDLYGEHRFRQATAPKRAALRAGTALVLLPQTYGPFADPRMRAQARSLVAGAALAYSRDADSHAALLDLAGDSTDASRLVQGVDVAFALPVEDPGEGISAELRALLVDRAAGVSVAGVNVSGLLWHDGQLGGTAAATYPTVVREVVSRLVAEGAHVALVAHVAPAVGGGESDATAVSELLEQLSPGVRANVTVVPAHLQATELKWVIAHCDWFWGARMHATIAALSTTVPAAATAYSPKTAGVFASCGVRDHVVDGREAEPGAAVEQLLALYSARRRTAEHLRRSVPTVVSRATSQLDEMLATVLTDRSGARAVGG